MVTDMVDFREPRPGRTALRFVKGRVSTASAVSELVFTAGEAGIVLNRLFAASETPGTTLVELDGCRTPREGPDGAVGLVDLGAAFVGLVALCRFEVAL